MSTHAQQPAPENGLPLWSGMSILAAALLTGALLSLSAGRLGGTFLICFGLGAAAVIAFIRPTRMFLMVALIPIIYAIITPLGGWIVTGQGQFSTTAFLAGGYPLFQFFPILILVSLGALALGYLRVRLVQANRVSAERQSTAANRRRRQANSETVARKVTVDELIRQARADRAQRSSDRSVDSDLY
ncbi:MAG: DUF6542 domain-containing protein [Corynebacterium sp.]|nr:DUF6542 domain-containing protein [Corynebacterium sp.]